MSPINSSAQTHTTKSADAAGFVVETLAQDLGVIWGMDFIRDSELVFTNRSGRLGVLNTHTRNVSWVQGLPDIKPHGQGGLLDVKAYRAIAGETWLYFTYAKRTQRGKLLSADQFATTLARAQLIKRSGGNYQLERWRDLLITRSASSGGQHFGSRIAFAGAADSLKTQHLFFSVGDRGHRPNGQDLSTHAGSILHVTLEGKAPANNPFISNPKALDEIWSYGHRNPQGLAFDKRSKTLWAIEHGPRGGDEINLIEPGNNYGWPVISYGKEYWGPLAVGEGTHKAGMQQPFKVYTPSIAPGSLLLYSGRAFPNWRGNLFAGALKLQHLNRVVISPQHKITSEERLLSDLNERVRALAQDIQGRLLLSTDSGKILRISPHAKGGQVASGAIN